MTKQEEHLAVGVAPNRGRIGALAAFAGAALLVAALILTLLSPSTAGAAAVDYERVGEFGSLGTAPGEFGGEPAPGRAVVHEPSGKLLFVDTANDRIQVFDPVTDASDSEFPAQVDEDAEIGELHDGSPIDTPIGIAVDAADDSVYVSVAGAPDDGGTIHKFDPDDPADPSSFTHDQGFSPQADPVSGAEPGSYGQAGDGGGNPRGGIAFDPTTSDILLADPGSNRVWRFDTDGSYLDDFDGSESGDVDAFDHLYDLAVDSAGEILVSDFVTDEGNEGTRVERFDASGDHLTTLPMPETTTNQLYGSTISVDRVTDEVFVGYKLPGEIAVTDGQIAPPQQIAQFFDDQLVREIQAPDNRFDLTIAGIAIHNTDPDESLPGERLYVMAIDNVGDAFGGDGEPRVQVFDSIGFLASPPECSIDPAFDVTASSASFTGTVNPGGDETDWAFQYRPVGASQWLQEPEAPNSTGGGEADVGVGPETATGLEPSTEYQARIWARNFAECETLEAPENNIAFETGLAAPVVETLEATSISAFRATLIGEIDPSNADTLYQFELRPLDGGPAILVPTEPATLEGTEGPSQVSSEATGLDPDTAYEYRLTAWLDADDELADEGEPRVSFRTRSAADSALPERGYELVSRVDNNSVVPVPYRASIDGDAFLYTGWVPAAGAENGNYTYQRMTRNDDGSWSPDPHMATPPVDPDRSNLGASSGPLLSGDLSLGMFGTVGSYHPIDQNEARDTYLRSTETGDLTWVSRDPNDAGAQTDPADAARTMYLSPDGELAAFVSSRQFAETHDSGNALYKWDSGDLTHISVDPSGENVHNSTLGLGNYTRNAVSPEGDRIAFSTRFPNRLLVYIRGEAATREVGGGDDPGRGDPADYFGADSETTEILYRRNEALYLYDVEADRSIEISPDVRPSLPHQRDRAVFGISDDGNRIFFSSEEELAPGATQGAPNLYLAERLEENQDHEIRFVTVIHPEDEGIQPRQPQSDNDVQLDSTGSILAFTSRAELVAGRRTGGFPQVYVYETEADRLYCASCPPDGSVPTSYSDIGAKSATGGWRLNLLGSSRLPALRNVTESGSVFFQSTARVLPADTNDRIDTYEWRGGELRLISSGRGTVNQLFAGASADGETVFFQSNHDWVDHGGVRNQRRVYAARVGGGFVPPEPEADCVGEECRGDASTQPAPSIGSSELRRELREPERVDRALRIRCTRIVRHVKASRARAIALVRIARRSRGARRRVALSRARAFAKRSRALRVHVHRCRKALR